MVDSFGLGIEKESMSLVVDPMKPIQQVKKTDYQDFEMHYLTFLSAEKNT